MSFQCLDPFVAVNLYTKEDGKKFLKLFSKSRLNYDLNTLKDHYGSDNVFTLPCGRCESCRRNKAEDWAIRCELEAKEHKFNYFVTLTFDDFHYEKASEEELFKFFDRLEGEHHKRKFKYFACKELGETTERLHFHCVLFCDFEIDLFKPIKIGNFYHYESKFMNQLWKNGFYTISPFECSCARYVAKYTAKNSKLYMSRNIGKSYFLKHFPEIIKDNFKVYSNFGGKMSAYIPQAFVRWFDEMDPAILSNFKIKKRDLARLVMNEKRRALVAEHEEDVIRSDQSRVKEKERNKRRI